MKEPIEILTVDYKVYLIDKTEEELRKRAIEYDYASKNKNWFNDFEGCIRKKMNEFSDDLERQEHLCGNNFLLFRHFKGEPKDIEKRIMKYRYRVETKSRKKYDDISYENDILPYILVINVGSPTSFPKYSNEIPFLYDKKRPDIIKMYWDGYQWQYKLKNIGHEYDFVSEYELNKYNIK